jgi:glycosyltransferase involved in cell wall biosynthesis
MIGVIIPAHNEIDHLRACVESILVAAQHPALLGERVAVMVVLDSCTDASAESIADLPVERLDVEALNVGVARATGAQHLLQRGARWLAFTDADSRVPANWLSLQMAAECDVFCGPVSVDDWQAHTHDVRQRYDSHYQSIDGHPHVHGANMGVSAKAYLSAGGFPPLACHEDIGLISRLIAQGARIARLAEPCVITSGRAKGRVLGGGFAQFLTSLAEPG